MLIAQVTSTKPLQVEKSLWRKKAFCYILDSSGSEECSLFSILASAVSRNAALDTVM
jgi:hypothetical protein